MKYYSLNNKAHQVDFAEAAITGQSPDKGLYFPTFIPQVERSLIDNIEYYSNEEIAFRVIKPYIGNILSNEVIYKIASESIAFPIPLVSINDNICSLELFHGPTMAFKDVGARFMSRCLSQLMPTRKKGKVVVLVATSGDTGGAVANGFFDVPGIEVVILYPSGKVSPVQEMQLTGLGKNITALEIQGDFDDCQDMVKKAFTDQDINKNITLTSANSINVARWLPQQFYYFLCWKEWKYKNIRPVISVPSGNFGNLCAGVLACCSGLPVKHFIAACNSNKVVPKYFETGVYTPVPSIRTYSNAMDVGNPSNFVRLITLLQEKEDISISSISVTDKQTLQTIKETFEQYKYLLDPHGAVAYFALQNYQKYSRGKGVILETAHPVKFPSIVESVIDFKIEIPEQISDLMKNKKQSTLLPPEFTVLKEFLMELK